MSALIDSPSASAASHHTSQTSSPGGRDPGNQSALRGSLLFLVGRVASMALGLVTQVIIVRSLSKEDFGSFAYALALAALIQSFLALGLDRADTYFLTRFDEGGDTGRVLGLLVTELAVVACCGLVSLGALFIVARQLIEGVPVSVVLLLAATAPLMAADALVLNAFAVFSEPRAIFLRRYVLDPLLRLSVVIVLALTGMHLVPLATGYLVAAGAGTILYLGLLLRLTRRVVARHQTRRHVVWPGSEVFRYALPLLVGSVMYAATTSLPTLMLQHFGSLDAVAELRAVQPVAALILVVPTVFATLFLPRAARLSARGDDAGLRQHYWTTAICVAVLAFPAVVLSVAFAPTVTSLLFGVRYHQASWLLAIMAMAFYANAALGLNGSLLQVTGRVRLLVVANLAGLATAGLAGALLIPSYGAYGAAGSVAAALGVPQLIKQISLRHTAVRSATRPAVKLWICAGLLTVLAVGVFQLGARGPFAAVSTTLLCWGALIMIMRRELVSSNMIPWPRRLRRRRKPPGGPHHGAAAGDAATEAMPGTWACLDWRFLEGDARLGTVFVVDDRPQVAKVLRTLGERAADLEPASRGTEAFADTVLVPWSCCTSAGLASARRALRPGGRLVVELDGRPPGRSWRAILTPWTAVSVGLRQAGFGSRSSYVALPSLRRTSAFVDRQERQALLAALRRQPVKPVKRLAAQVAVLAVRAGLGQLVCRQGVVISHLQPDEPHVLPR